MQISMDENYFFSKMFFTIISTDTIACGVNIKDLNDIYYIKNIQKKILKLFYISEFRKLM